jgi:hypothetical protein
MYFVTCVYFVSLPFAEHLSIVPFHNYAYLHAFNRKQQQLNQQQYQLPFHAAITVWKSSEGLSPEW